MKGLKSIICRAVRDMGNRQAQKIISETLSQALHIDNPRYCSKCDTVHNEEENCCIKCYRIYQKGYRNL